MSFSGNLEESVFAPALGANKAVLAIVMAAIVDKYFLIIV
ncbi:hypothetical protein N24_1354 [Corynebacterium suranareeae]|uniref:Uncharacterized protein n=1 Tax=Corynebacterium suranareeae TaxID=2506452 RepID=A0A160PPZ8_9CORY|nr:hypothetical protein N24_1354 [Corynebacterium suranareeae]